MFRAVALFVAALLIGVSAPVKACTFSVPVHVGAKLTDAQLREQERRGALAFTKEKRLEALQREATSSVNFSEELAELLIPNIRPIYLQRSSCGSVGEVDLAGGLDQRGLDIQALFNDTRISRLKTRDFVRLIRESGVGDEYGSECNREFRLQFASHLSARLEPSALRSAWLFLIARSRNLSWVGSTYHRLMYFSGASRHPPVAWWGDNKWIRSDLQRFIARTREGRKLERAIQQFWVEQDDRLSDNAHVCPNAQAAWLAERENLIQAILKEDQSRRAN